MRSLLHLPDRPRRGTPRRSAVLLVAALLATTTSCLVPAMRPDECLARDTVTVLEGLQPRYPNAKKQLSPGLAVDAREARWTVPVGTTGMQKYPLAFEGSSTEVCFVGGHVRNELPHETTTWNTWHGTGAAVVVKIPRFKLIGTHVENVGDAISISSSAADGWTLSGVHVQDAHDDCIQNDFLLGGRVDDSFFDGCYAFYSARGPRGTSSDGTGRLVRITNSLVHMKPMPHVFRPDKYQAPGHGPIFKLSEHPDWGRSPDLAVHNTIFRVDENATIGGVGIPTFNHDRDPSTPGLDYLADCSNNVVVWTGAGDYPDPLPDCFEVTRDVGVWDAAVAQWHADR